MSSPSQPSRRAVLTSAAAGLAGLALGAGSRGSSASPATDRWNVLLLVSDEHNPRFLHAAGASWLQTPNLDRLAAEGVRCTRATATSPVCAPARMGILTGNHPQETGVLSNGHVLNPRTRTLAHVFGTAGYTTACFGKTHANHPSATYGFDHFLTKDTEAYKLLASSMKESTRSLPVPAAEQALWDGIADRRLRAAPTMAEHTLLSGIVLATLERWLDEPRDRPFFAYASWTEPHHPWVVPARLYGLYKPEDVPLPPQGLKLSPIPDGIRRENGWDKLSEAQQRLCLSKYAAAVTYTDEVVGKILAMLKARGLDRNTIVVYTTDHGDMAAEKGMWLKGVMYEPAVGIPLIIRMPGRLGAGRTTDALVSGADLLPTLASLTGVPVPDVSGLDLSAALSGTDMGPRHLFATLGGQPDGKLPGQLMVRDARYKLIRYRATPATGRVEYQELYDLVADPSETRDLMSTPVGKRIAREMTALSDTWLASRRACPYPVQRVVDLPQDADLDDPELEWE